MTLILKAMVTETSSRMPKTMMEERAMAGLLRTTTLSCQTWRSLQVRPSIRGQRRTATLWLPQGARLLRNSGLTTPLCLLTMCLPATWNRRVGSSMTRSGWLSSVRTRAISCLPCPAPPPASLDSPPHHLCPTTPSLTGETPPRRPPCQPLVSSSLTWSPDCSLLTR